VLFSFVLLVSCLPLWTVRNPFRFLKLAPLLSSQPEASSLFPCYFFFPFVRPPLSPIPYALGPDRGGGFTMCNQFSFFFPSGYFCPKFFGLCGWWFFFFLPLLRRRAPSFFEMRVVHAFLSEILVLRVLLIFFFSWAPFYLLFGTERVFFSP